VWITSRSGAHWFKETSMIEYPVDVAATRWAVYDVASETILDRQHMWPRGDGGEIIGQDPNIRLLQHTSQEKPACGPTEVLTTTEVVDLDNDELRVEYSVTDVSEDNLTTLKATAISETDANTEAVIVGGFSHDGQTFSSSVPAQENFKGSKIKQLDGRGVPTQWSLIDGGVYAIADEAAWNALYQAAENHVESSKIAGLVARGQISACTTIAELKAVMGW
jgi:hypothetical protein